MRTEYRLTFIAKFDTLGERDKMYDSLKTAIIASVKDSGLAKEGVITKDEYMTNDPSTSEKVI